MLAVESEHRPEIDPGQDVPVDYQKRFGCRAKPAQGAGGAEWALFRQIADLHAEVLTVAEMARDSVAEVMGRHPDVADPRVTQPVDGQLEQRTVTHWQHGLRRYSVSGRRRVPYPPAMMTAERPGRLRPKIAAEPESRTTVGSHQRQMIEHELSAVSIS